VQDTEFKPQYSQKNKKERKGKVLVKGLSRAFIGP
jgi:hypothetical protein